VTLPPDSTLQPGASLLVTCDRLDHDGLGVAEVRDQAGRFRLHVAGALPGECVRARVAHVSPHARAQGRDAWAELEEIASASPERVAPPCPVQPRCGGCPLAIWAYAAQVEWKRDLVVEAMAGQGLAEVPIASCLPSPRPFGYRGNAKYVFGPDREGRLVLGAYAPRSHEIVDMSGCLIGEPALAEVAAALLTLLCKYAVAPFDEILRTGLLRYAILRANADGKVLVALVTGREGWPQAETLARELAAACPAVLGVVHNINSASGNALFGEQEHLLFGCATIEDSIGPARVRLGPRSFAQANRLVAGRAYQDIVAAAAGLGSIDRVVDAYAGAGGIALALAPLAREVVAIEENPAACATAQAFLVDRGPDRNVRIVIGDVADHLAQAGTAELVVLNPPRKGCSPAVLEAVVQLRPRLVAYLSCSPDSLARDLAALACLGLRTVSVTPYDMLPHTPHVEALALLGDG
jgi:23S rRNA (uracil1939-C5)-methyltransferase